MTAIQDVVIETIQVGPRLRPADPQMVEALARSMAREGLLQPIGVIRTKGTAAELVWGLHRLEAARQLGWEVISARLVSPHLAGSATDLEALENLTRADLAPYDRAMAVAAIRRGMLVAAGLAPDADARMARGLIHADGVEPVKMTVSDLAERLGASLITVERDLRLARSLKPETAAAMRGRDGWFNGRVVLACAELGAQQHYLVNWLSSRPHASLKEALKALNPAPPETPTRDAAAAKALAGAFARLSLGQRVPVLVEAARMMTAAQRADLAEQLARLQADEVTFDPVTGQGRRVGDTPDAGAAA